jgi:hypothetical protein
VLVADGTQVRGQLMGSIVSFPVLCIINAAVTRRACEFSANRKLTLAQAPFAVNGDDVIARLTPLAIGYWRLATGFVGLEMSVGKTYVSRSTLNMNSTMFFRGVNSSHPIPGSRAGVSRECPFQRVFHVMSGPLFGMKRSESDKSDVVGDERNWSLGQNAHEILKFSPDHLRPVLLDCFIRNNLTELRKTRLPWFIPASLGGIGLPALFSFDPQSAVDQSRISSTLTGINGDEALAPAIRHEHHVPDPDVRFIPRPSDPSKFFGPSDIDLRIAHSLVRALGRPSKWQVPQALSKAPTWLMHKYVLTHLPAEPDVVPLNSIVGSNYQRLYSLLAVQAVMDSPYEKTVTIDEVSDSPVVIGLHDAKPKERQLQCLRHNEKIWSPSSWRGKILPPANFFRLSSYHPPLRVLPCAPG